MSEPLVTDQFTILLRQFNKLVATDPPIDRIITQLGEIRQKASDSDDLNVRQKTAIIARVDNYLAGTYGSTSKKHIVHEHVKGSK